MKYFGYLALIYCGYSIYQGYKLLQIDKEVAYLKPATTWCSQYTRPIYGFDLRQVGCLYANMEDK